MPSRMSEIAYAMTTIGLLNPATSRSYGVLPVPSGFATPRVRSRMW
jgi:hypothetical protein